MFGAGAFGDEIECVQADGLGDGVGGGVDGDLQLLAPELGLLGLDFVLELGGVVLEFELLLSQFEHGDGDGEGAQQSQKQFDHEGVPG